MSRLKTTLARAAEDGRAALVIYLTHGDPSPGDTVSIIEEAARAGADVIELGVPFSDPNADGPVIQAAMQRALRAGGGLQGALDTVATLRERGCQVPVVLFGYYNPIFVRGVDRFAQDAARAGVDAVLTVDVPMDELAELHDPLRRAGVDVIPLLAPTSDPERVARARAFAPPFIYYISMTGVTGGAFRGATGGADRVADIRAATGAPVAVGFGIKTPEHARAVSAYADAVVVGSAVVSRIAGAAPGRAAEDVAAFVAELRAGL